MADIRAFSEELGLYYIHKQRDDVSPGFSDTTRRVFNALKCFLPIGDDAIDLIFRVFCVPGRDNVVAIDPTHGMYSVCAAINDVEYRKVPLDDEFQTTSTQLLSACNDKTWILSHFFDTSSLPLFFPARDTCPI